MRPSRPRALGVALAAAACAVALVAADAPAPAQLKIGAFSASGGELPPGWEPLLFEKIPRHTRYDLVEDEGRWVVRARSDAAASGLKRDVRVDLESYPILRWSWKVENVLERGDITSREGDDYPARLYVAFAYQPERTSFGRRLRYLAARVVLGDLPIGALTYVWASHAPVGTLVSNAYAGDFVRMLVVDSGEEHSGRWRSVERDVYADYLRAFGQPPPPVEGLAIMTDTDNTGESATAWYGDILLEARAAR